MLTRIHALVNDLRYATRTLATSRLFTAAAVLSLGLSLGANSAMFSLFNEILWRPMPVDDPDSLVQFYRQVPGMPLFNGISYPDYREYLTQGVVRDLAAYTLTSVALTSGGQDTVTAWGEAVTGNYFAMLKPPLHLGRGIRPEEATAEKAEPVAVLGYAFWQRQFGGDRSVAGRTVRLNGEPFTIVGVADRAFHGAYSTLMAADIWIPIGSLSGARARLENRRNQDYFPIGRLAAGMDAERTQAAVRLVAARLADQYPDTNRGQRVHVLREADTRPFINLAAAARSIASGFLVVAFLVLLIACANVANLLLGRAAGRRREVATRVALGATRGQLVRQFLAESFVVALLAGTVGLVVAMAAVRMLGLLPLAQFGLPLVIEPHVDVRVVLFTLVLSVAAALVFGVVPALKATNRSVVDALKAGDSGPRAAKARVTRAFSLNRILVIGQIASSLLLLVLAGLFARSIGGVTAVDPGFRIDNRFVVQPVPALAGYTRESSQAYYRTLLERVKGIPGVESATLASRIPLSLGGRIVDVTVEGYVARRGEEKVTTEMASVDGDYFRTMDTQIVAGRPIDRHDTAQNRPVIVVNQLFARRYWPGRDPLGKRVQLNAPSGPWLEVVGVAEDGKYEALFEPPLPYIFVPCTQQPQVNMTVVAVSRREPGGILAALRRGLREADAKVPVLGVGTMTQHMGRQQVLPKMLASLVVPAGALAALIAIVGLYAVTAYSVGRRTREIGIRVAVGAAPRNVLRMILREGAVLAGAGCAIGVALALATTRMVAGILFGVSATDPWIFIGVPALLLSVAAVASYLPARRALAIAPLVALRHE